MAAIHAVIGDTLTFMGVPLGNNVQLPYSVEEDTKTPPQLTLTLRRSGEYMVLDGGLITGSTVDSDVVAENIAAPKRGLESALSGKATGAMNGVRMAGKQSKCTGYMVLRFTPRAVAADSEPVSKNPKEMKKLRDLQHRMQHGEDFAPNALTQDLVLATAYNIARENTKLKAYGVHAKKGDNGQVHVEQILAYKLRAFLGHLEQFTNDYGSPFVLANIAIEGNVYFSFSDNTHTGMECPACGPVWVSLKADYRSTAGILICKD